MLRRSETARGGGRSSRSCARRCRSTSPAAGSPRAPPRPAPRPPRKARAPGARSAGCAARSLRPGAARAVVARRRVAVVGRATRPARIPTITSGIVSRERAGGAGMGGVRLASRSERAVHARRRGILATYGPAGRGADAHRALWPGDRAAVTCIDSGHLSGVEAAPRAPARRRPRDNQAVSRLLDDERVRIGSWNPSSPGGGGGAGSGHRRALAATPLPRHLASRAPSGSSAAREAVATRSTGWPRWGPQASRRRSRRSSGCAGGVATRRATAPAADCGRRCHAGWREAMRATSARAAGSAAGRGEVEARDRRRAAGRRAWRPARAAGCSGRRIKSPSPTRRAGGCWSAR